MFHRYGWHMVVKPDAVHWQDCQGPNEHKSFLFSRKSAMFSKTTECLMCQVVFSALFRIKTTSFILICSVVRTTAEVAAAPTTATANPGYFWRTNYYSVNSHLSICAKKLLISDILDRVDGFMTAAATDSDLSPHEFEDWKNWESWQPPENISQLTRVYNADSSWGFFSLA